jgi:hypothetical protein
MERCVGTHTQNIGKSFKSGAKRAAKSANNITESSWETLAQSRLIARISAFFKAYTWKEAWKATGERLLIPCYLSRVNHNRKIRTRKQRTDVGIYSFVTRTIKRWNLQAY